MAIERYRQVLAADDRNSNAIRALGRLYEAREQWPEYAEVLRKEVELPDVSPDDVIQLRFRLAQVLEAALADVDGAIAAYRDILDTQSDHTPAIQSLEQIFARKIKQAEVAAILKPIYESQGEWEKLAQLHEAALESLTAPADRLAAMHSQAELFEEKLSDAVGALSWYSRALREAPLDEKSLNEAERLAGSTNAWADLAGTYADIVEASDKEPVKQSIGKKLARIYEEELNDIENAEAAYNYVLSVVPLDAEALERLDVIYTGTGNAERLAQVLDRRVQAATEATQKVELSYRLAQILETELQQLEPAISRYRSIVDQLDPKHEEALNALERLFNEAELWPDLFATYEKKLDVAFGDSDRADILAKMASLAAGQLAKPDEAVRLWNEVLTLRGEDPDALHNLANLHEAAGRYQDLIDVLERQLASSDDVDARAQTAMRIPRVYESALNDRERAIEGYRRVLDIDPNSLEALAALANIYRQAQNWDELVATLQTSIQIGTASVEANQVRDWWAGFGNIFQNTLQQPFEAWTRGATFWKWTRRTSARLSRC